VPSLSGVSARVRGVASEDEYALGEAHHALLTLRQYIYDEIDKNARGDEFATETRQLMLAAILVELRQIRSVLRNIASELEDD
jgi:hypothetical protein